MNVRFTTKQTKNMNNSTKKPLLFGIMMTAGSAIGAGMFSLPIVASGMWFPLTLVSLFVIWSISYLSSLMIMEISLTFPIGSSFNTFTEHLLGKAGSVVMGISVGFLLYILLYAYFSAFGNMAVHTLAIDTSESAAYTQGFLGLILGCLIAVIVWISTVSVGRISTILVVGMAISFIISISGAFSHVNTNQLIDFSDENGNYIPYLWAGLAYFITSFGFSSMVPSLYKYYGKDIPKIKGSLFFGSLLALVTYLIWLMVTFGIIERADFIPINAAGGNMGDLVGALEQKIGSSTIQSALTLFSNFAIISSFLGVGLNLFDYIADRFGFSNDLKGRFYTACITFLPPGLFSLLWPHGFIAAIGFAGIVIFIGFFLLPFLMVKKLRASNETAPYQLSGGNSVLLFVLIMSTITAVCHVLAMLDILPKL